MSSKILLINDNEPSDNIGCRITGKGLRHTINEKNNILHDQIYIDDLFRGERVTLLPRKNATKLVINRLLNRYAFDTFKNITKPKRIHNLQKEIYELAPENFDELTTLANLCISSEVLEDIQNSIRSADVVAINGEGAFSDKDVHARWMMFYAYLAKNYLNAKTILTNLSISIDNMGSGLKEMFLRVCPMLDKVICREPRSYEIYGNKISDNHHLAADAAFANYDTKNNLYIEKINQNGFIDVWHDEELPLEDPYICIGGNSVFTDRRSSGFPIDEYTELVNEIENLANIVLVPSKATDERRLRLVANKTKVPLVSVKNSPQTIQHIIGNSELYIGGRYHQAVLAIKMGRPVIGLSTKLNTKLEGLLEHSNIDTEIFDSYNVGSLAANIKSEAEYVVQNDINTQSSISRLQQLAKENIPDDI